jgi:hypothetical protein
LPDLPPHSGHRYGLYTQAEPHKGYEIILELGNSMRDGYFCFTSNVDGHFARYQLILL